MIIFTAVFSQIRKCRYRYFYELTRRFSQSCTYSASFFRIVKIAGRYDFSFGSYKLFFHLPSLKIPILIRMRQHTMNCNTPNNPSIIIIDTWDQLLRLNWLCFSNMSLNSARWSSTCILHVWWPPEMNSHKLYDKHSVHSILYLKSCFIIATFILIKYVRLCVILLFRLQMTR